MHKHLLLQLIFGFESKVRDVLFEYQQAVIHFGLQLDMLEVCPLYSRLLTAIPILQYSKILRRNSNKTSLVWFPFCCFHVSKSGNTKQAVL